MPSQKISDGCCTQRNLRDFLKFHSHDKHPLVVPNTQVFAGGGGCLCVYSICFLLTKRITKKKESGEDLVFLVCVAIIFVCVRGHPSCLLAKGSTLFITEWIDVGVSFNVSSPIELPFSVSVPLSFSIRFPFPWATQPEKTQEQTIRQFSQSEGGMSYR